MRRINLFFGLTLTLLLLSFQCHKPYKDNSTILIEGQFVDEQNQALNNFEFYLSRRDIGVLEFEERLSNEKVLKTDLNGNFSFLTPEFLSFRERSAVLVFIDTTYRVEYIYFGDTLLLPYLPVSMGTNSGNQEINFGTVNLQQ